MPDHDSKKNQHKKGKGDPKDQRKPRQNRNQGAGQNKSEKRIEESKVSEKQVYEEPGPEFYKGLKRETDDILKITEDANSKYKKKEIQSNWAKYEVPIDSYDDMEEQENLGADYEKLIQAPLSLGGHFQFKHEKSWDITSGPSVYDKYFDINMNDLYTALCTIPFYERNCIDKSIFSENDIQTMDQRTSRYKHKYFKISTTESEIQDKFSNSLKDDSYKLDDVKEERKSESEINKSDETEINFDESSKTVVALKEDPIEIVFKRADEHKIEPTVIDNDNSESKQDEVINSIDDLIVEIDVNVNKKENKTKTHPIPNNKLEDKATNIPTEPKKTTVIESPEDLEKWLDDFLED